MKDYASVSRMDKWLRHPAMGDPSFDTFEKVGDTVHVSEYPYEWTVNGSLFIDHDDTWYLYAGLYPLGYADRAGCASHFEIYRSTDRGRSWTWLGAPFSPDFHMDGVTHPVAGCPDCVLFYDPNRKKYLLTYDWGTDNATWEASRDYAAHDADAGAAVAWGDTPAGPFERLTQSVYRNARIQGRYGRFSRMYATTVIPRAHDYLALILCDSGPHFAWALAGATAKSPEEDFDDPVMLLNADGPTYYPAPMEFYPAFVVDGTVYAPATSVAANRNYQVLFSAPLEQAHEPGAWRLERAGSLWHARALADERYGIWGQTFSGMVCPDGVFRVMYPSRDERGHGTLSVAARRWEKPVSDGFTLSGHAAPSVTLLRDAYRDFDLSAAFDLSGGFADILFDFHGVVGADKPESDCGPDPRALNDYTALRVSGAVWTLVRDGVPALTGRAGRKIASVRLHRRGGTLEAWAGDEKLFKIDWPAAGAPAPVGLRTDQFTVLRVDRFAIDGDPAPAAWRVNDADALLGGGVGDADMTLRDGHRFTKCRVKWNVTCARFTLYGLKGPALHRAQLRVDGEPIGVADFSAPTAGEGEIFASPALEYGPHGIELIPMDGEVAVPEMGVQ